MRYNLGHYRIKRAAIGRDESFRARMLRRNPDIYVSGTFGGAGTYSKTSPELLITSLNILRRADPEQARRFIEELAKEGWLDAKPIVLQIAIERHHEVGIERAPHRFVGNDIRFATPTADLPELTQELIRAAAGVINELILQPLPIDRVIDVSEVSEEHALLQIKRDLEKTAKSVSAMETAAGLAQASRKLIIKAMEVEVSPDETKPFIDLVNSFPELVTVHEIFMKEIQREGNMHLVNLFRSTSEMNAFHRQLLLKVETALKAFRGSAFRGKIKDTTEYLEFKSTLIPVLAEIAAAYAFNYYISTNHRYMHGVRGNAFYLAREGGISQHNTSVLAIDEAGAEAALSGLGIPVNEAIKAFGKLLDSTFITQTVQDPLFDRRF